MHTYNQIGPGLTTALFNFHHCPQGNVYTKQGQREVRNHNTRMHAFLRIRQRLSWPRRGWECVGGWRSGHKVDHSWKPFLFDNKRPPKQNRTTTVNSTYNRQTLVTMANLTPESWQRNLYVVTIEHLIFSYFCSHPLSNNAMTQRRIFSSYLSGPSARQQQSGH